MMLFQKNKMEQIVKYKGFELLFELNNGNSTYIDTVVEKCKYIRRDYLINKILNEKIKNYGNNKL